MRQDGHVGKFGAIIHVQWKNKKPAKPKTARIRKMCYIGRSYILENLRSVGEDKESQLSSSLVMIHMTEAMKTLLKSLHNPPFYAHHTIKKGSTLLTVHMPPTGAVS